MRTSFIGGGVMAEAILGGVLDAEIASPSDVTVGEPVEARRAHLARKYGVEAVSDNLAALSGAGIVVLAVKPQNLDEVMRTLKGNLEPAQVAISIVAGAKLKTLTEGLGHPMVVRVMPNTPAQIRAGMTVWTASPEVSEDKLAATGEILRTLGAEVFVSDEKLMDMATALSASGPAYVFLFIEALIDSGVYMGMPRDMARELVLETVIGSARFAKESGGHPGELKDMVSSPGGGTVEALKVFEQRAFHGAVIDAVYAAYKKYQALGRQG